MQVKVLQHAPREHSAILLTFIKQPFVFQTFVLSNFEWSLKTGFTVVKPSISLTVLAWGGLSYLVAPERYHAPEIV